MSMERKSTVWGLALASVAVAVAACGSKASEPPVAWNCDNADVPNGTAYQCTSTDARTLAASVTVGGSYTCPSGGPATAQCPPAAEDAPPPGEDAGPPAEDSPPPGDAGTLAPDATPSQPPAQDGPPPADAGTPPGSGGDDASPPGKGNPGKPPHGGPNGNPPGSSSGGSCTCDSDGSPPTEGAPDASDSPPPGEGSPDASGGPPPGEGSPDAGGPPYNCQVVEGETLCTMPPSCAPGTHPSACGACVPDDTTDDCVPPLRAAAGSRAEASSSRAPVRTASAATRWT